MCPVLLPLLAVISKVKMSASRDVYSKEMVRAVKRKAAELGYEIAESKTLADMTPKEIKLMNAEFKTVANNTLLAERAIKVSLV